MTDLRFYVSEPRLLKSNGESVPVSLSENGRWQQAQLALIDLEDGSGHCTNGTPESNASLRGAVPKGDYTGLQFTLGVPFEQNHADPLTASAPLDDSTMHWHWRSGYKFLRIGLANENDGFWMHLGSAGCQGTIQNITGCRFPNRMTVTLPDFRPGDGVLIDVGELLQAVDLSDGAVTSCSSGPAENGCRKPFRVFGIDFDNGVVTGNTQLFRTARR